MVVTGVETAGLVLAAFPILISASEHYRKGLEPVKIWWRYAAEVRIFHAIDCQQRLFINCCEVLLSITGVSGKEAAVLLGAPAGDLWRTPVLEERLKTALGDSYTSYFREVQSCLQLVNELLETLGHPEQTENVRDEAWSASTGADVKHHLIFTIGEFNCQNRQTLWRCESGTSTLDALGTTLSDRTSDTEVDDTRGVPGSAAESFQADDERMKQAMHSVDGDMAGQFPLHSFPSMQLSPVTLSQTQSLCRKMRSTSDKDDSRYNSCLWTLVHGSGTEHRFHVVTQPKKMKLVPLRDILMRQEDHPGLGLRSGLSPRHRLELAPRLASGSLELHSSPWLNNAWTSKDILLEQTVPHSTSGSTMQPFVQAMFQPSNEGNAPGVETAANTGRPLIRNNTLFDLAVILIELAYNRPLEQMHLESELGADGTPNMWTTALTASRLQKTMFNEVLSDAYLNAVRRCLFCDFDRGEVDLGKEAFLSTVYSSVVKPLADDYNSHDLRAVQV